jgi:polyhydroxyalkanoate synthase
MRLYRYEPLAPRRVATPLLVVYSLIGRYTMMDLQPDRSIVRNLLEQGIEIYILDWGNPGRADHCLRFEDYVEEYVARSVEHICAAEGVGRIAALGVCEGGVFTASYAALHPERISHLAVAVTPFDFHADQREPARLEHGFLNRWARNVDAEVIEDMIDSFGYLPGYLTGLMFQEMTPGKTLSKYNWDLPDALAGSREQALHYLRMEKWLADRPHHPAAAAKQWIVELYRENRLARGEFYLDGERVDLGRLTMPIINVFALKDHIIPAPTSRALRDLAGTDDYTELELPVGHIGTFVSRKANGRFSDTLAEWLINRQPQTAARPTRPSEAAA